MIMDANIQAEAQLANIALKFLERTDLKGSEYVAFSKVVQWLQAKAEAPNIVLTDPLNNPNAPALDQDRAPEAAE